LQALFLYLKETEGVGAFPILPDLEVQVVTGGISGGADVADHLALLHFLPNRYADGGTMGVQGIEGIVVVYLDVVSIPAAPRVDGVGYGDGSVCCGKDGRTFRRGDVGSAMVGDLPGKRIFPVAKP